MKKISLLLFGLIIIYSCKQDYPKDYLTLSGKIENNKDSIISIANREGVIKEIIINADGTFKDTLKVENAAIYTFEAGEQRAPIYLKNGYNIFLKGNSEDFLKSFKFSGEGSSNSNFIIAQVEKSQSIGNPQEILNLEEVEFRNKVAQIKFAYDSILDSYTNLDSTLYTSVKAQNNQIIDYFNNAFGQNKVMGKGKPSPIFENYTDIKGGVKSLESFKGKFVYIDIWATWCGPCIEQIPYLQSLEKAYRGKNVEFVSISTDESQRSGGSWVAAEKKWRDFVKDRNMTGVQLWSGQDFSFQEAYQINSIPRFILISPEGTIIDADAPRPSDPALKSLFTSLGI